MTFSICAREEFEREERTHYRFGVAVTTRLPGVGTLCPFVNEYGAVATQSSINSDLGRSGIAYLADGLAIADALQALLNADPDAPQRQLHGVDRSGSFTFSGDGCGDWYGHRDGENCTVAGNLLVGEEVLAATADTFEAGETDGPLAGRFIEALKSAHRRGGDKRDQLVEQSAAVRTVSTEAPPADGRRYYTDLRVDATETPLADLEEAYELALRRSSGNSRLIRPCSRSYAVWYRVTRTYRT